MKTLLLWLYMAVGILCAVYAFVYWLMNPELTQMQVTMQMWPAYLLIVLSSFGAALLLRRRS